MDGGVHHVGPCCKDQGERYNHRGIARSLSGECFKPLAANDALMGSNDRVSHWPYPPAGQPRAAAAVLIRCCS